MEKARQKQEMCTLKHCAKEFAKSMQSDISKEVKKLQIDALTGKIPTDQSFLNRVKAILKKNMKSKAAKQLTECNLEFCPHEMKTSFKMLAEHADIKVDWSKIETTEDYINLSNDIILSIFATMISQVKNKGLKANKKK